MQAFPRRWDILSRVNYLQRKIILNSIAYYEFNTNRLSDKEYDSICRQLVELQDSVNIDDTQYGYAFYDFDGTTGFDIYSRLNDKDKSYLLQIACVGLGVRMKTQNKPKIKKKKGGLF